jgi:hypothetical protein
MTDGSWTWAGCVVALYGGNPSAVRERAAQRAVSAELILHACRRAADNAAATAGVLPPLELWEATPPGCLDVRVFDQDQYWVDAIRIPHAIADRHDMTDDYLSALVGFLVEHAEHMLRGYEHYQPTEGRQPCEWIESTVLMRGLRAEITRRNSLDGAMHRDA